METKRRQIKGRSGTYEFLAELAKGERTTSHLAVRQATEGLARFQIVEEMLPHLAQDKKDTDRFLKEARITSRFDHPNMLRIKEIGKSKGVYFTILEFLYGDGLGFLLSQGLNKGQRIPQNLAAAIVAQACDGLDYAHELKDARGKPLGLIHQNVNPKNLILLFDGWIKVTNFDIANDAALPDSTRESAYLSPEQCLGKPVNPLTDVFSMGIVFWEALAGKHLFKRMSDLDTRRAIMSCQVPAARDFQKKVDEGLDGIALRALSKIPTDRFQSAAEMGMAIRSKLKDLGRGSDRRQISAWVEATASERIQSKRKTLEDIEAGKTDEPDTRPLLPATQSMMPLAGAEPKAASGEVPSLPPRPPKPPILKPTPPLPKPESANPESVPVAREPEPASPPESAAEEKPTETKPESGTEAPSPPEPAAEKEPIEAKPESETQAQSPPEPAAEEVPAEEEPESEAAPSPPPEPAEPEPPPIPPAEDTKEAQEGLTELTAHAPPKRGKPSGRRLVPLIAVGAVVVIAVVVLLAWPSVEGPDPDPRANGATAVDAASSDPTPDPVTLEPPPPNPDSASEPTSARLQVVSDPIGCRVELDGLAVEGRTPIASLEVAANVEHKIIVRCKRHQNDSKQVILGPGETSTLEFYPNRASAVGPRPPPRTIKPPPGKTGKLKLNTNPWTTVYLGKRKLGITPLLGVKLPVGTHTLRLVNQEEGIEKKVKISIEPGKTTSLLRSF